MYDPKERDVAAAPFTDRIVHHALVHHIEPLFERIFIYDSYACRVGKGTHAAARRLQHFLRSAHDKFGEFYILRADIRKFFASMDHEVLPALLGRQIKDARTLSLCAEIIGSYSEENHIKRGTSPRSFHLAQPDGQLPLSLRGGVPVDGACPSAI